MWGYHGQKAWGCQTLAWEMSVGMLFFDTESTLSSITFQCTEVWDKVKLTAVTWTQLLCGLREVMYHPESTQWKMMSWTRSLQGLPILNFKSMTLRLQLTIEKCRGYRCQWPLSWKSVYNFWPYSWPFASANSANLRLKTIFDLWLEMRK